MLESVSQFDVEQRGSEDERTRSLRARLMLLQGDLEGAGKWVDTFTDLPPDQHLLWLEEPQLTRARVLLARGAEADLQAVLQILDALYQIAERTHNTRLKIEILAMRAVALDAQGRNGTADAVLNEAVALARLGGFIRVFVDLGNPMQAILNRLEDRSPSGDYLHRLLAAFPDGQRKTNGGRALMPAGAGPAPNRPGPADRLTARERQVLMLLREPVGIKQIAHQLSLSPSTVKRHIANIYGKLDVNRRWDAVARAEELNIIPPR